MTTTGTDWLKRLPAKGEPHHYRRWKLPSGGYGVERSRVREPERELTELSPQEWERFTQLLDPKRNTKGCLFWLGPLTERGREPMYRFRRGNQECYRNVRSMLWQKLEPGAEELTNVRPIYKAACGHRRCVAYEHSRLVGEFSRPC